MLARANEYNMTDDTATYSGTVTVKILGDVDNSSSVDSVGLLQLRAAYATTVSSVNWNPECDFNRDNIIDAVDLFALGKNYGKTAP